MGWTWMEEKFPKGMCLSMISSIKDLSGRGTDGGRAKARPNPSARKKQLAEKVI
jgi:hypothetical protein